MNDNFHVTGAHMLSSIVLYIMFLLLISLSRLNNKRFHDYCLHSFFIHFFHWSEEKQKNVLVKNSPNLIFFPPQILNKNIVVVCHLFVFACYCCCRKTISDKRALLLSTTITKECTALPYRKHYKHTKIFASWYL